MCAAPYGAKWAHLSRCFFWLDNTDHSFGARAFDETPGNQLVYAELSGLFRPGLSSERILVLVTSAQAEQGFDLRYERRC